MLTERMSETDEPKIAVEAPTPKPKAKLSDEKIAQLKLARAKALEVRRERAEIKNEERKTMKREWEARRKLTEKKLADLEKEDEAEPDWDVKEQQPPPTQTQEQPRPHKGFERAEYGEPHPAHAGYWHGNPYPQQPPQHPPYGQPHQQYGYGAPPAPHQQYGYAHPPSSQLGHPPMPSDWSTAQHRWEHPQRAPQQKPHDQMSTEQLEDATAKEAYRKRIKQLKKESAYRSVFPDTQEMPF